MIRLQNQVEALLEEARIKLSSVISELLGLSGHSGSHRRRRVWRGWPNSAIASALQDALSGQIQPIHMQLLRLHLERLAMLDQQILELDQMAAAALEDAVIRLAQTIRRGWPNRSLRGRRGRGSVSVHFLGWRVPRKTGEWSEMPVRVLLRIDSSGVSFVRPAAVKKKGSYFQYSAGCCDLALAAISIAIGLEDSPRFHYIEQGAGSFSKVPRPKTGIADTGLLRHTHPDRCAWQRVSFNGAVQQPEPAQSRLRARMPAPHPVTIAPDHGAAHFHPIRRIRPRPQPVRLDHDRDRHDDRVGHWCRPTWRG